jgi:hypothetical protein
MATMFRGFSFDPASSLSHSQYEADRAAMNVSPTSKPAAHDDYINRAPTPPCTIGDLASKLNEQSLCIHARPTLASSTPPGDDYTTEQLRQPVYSRLSASLLRMQRQSSSRMQCTSSHVRDISRLVRMIQEEEQCTVNDDSSRTSSTSTSTASDEAIDMNYDVPAQGVEALAGSLHWGADGRRASSVRVTKTVRMRKRSGDRVEKKRWT